MIRDIILKNESEKPNGIDMEILHKYFTGCFNNEGKFDIDKFKEIIKADDVDITKEGYSLNFLGKSYARLLTSMDTTTVIKPDEEHNSKEENKNSNNIYISGDNIDAINHLLKSYTGAIKCIYIDPPYNTGSDGFVYNDNFNFTEKELQEKLSISEDEATKILGLKKDGSSSHSAWLMFMSSRLQLAKDLLTDDGVIFISIDDNEQANLKLLCDNIFGPENFISILCRKTVGSMRVSAPFELQNLNDFVLLYANNVNGNGKLNRNIVGEIAYEYEDEKGRYTLKDFQNSGEAGTRTARPNEYYPIYYNKNTGDLSLEQSDGYIEILPKKVMNDDGRWLWRKETFLKRKSELEFRNGKIQRKEYYNEREDHNKYKSYKNWLDTFMNGDGALNRLGMKGTFDFPKPIELIRYLLNIATFPKDCIVLDFFSGSATTAESVMRLNKEDGGKRKFILVQLPENLDENLEKAGNESKGTLKNAIDFLDSIHKPHTLDEIGMERIRRAAKKIKEEDNTYNGDLGFKHYTLIEPDENTIDKLKEYNPKAQIVSDSNTLEKFGKDTVLETYLVRDGYGLGAKVEEVELGKYKAYTCGNHLYLIDSGFDENSMVALVERYGNDMAFNPENVILFGYSFTYTQTEMIYKDLAILRNGSKDLKLNIDIRY